MTKIAASLLRIIEGCGVHPALVGDLHEESERGRSARWIYWQLVVALFVAFLERTRIPGAPIRIARALLVGCVLVIGAFGLRAQTGDQLTVIDRSATSDADRDLIRAIDDLPPYSATGWHAHRGEMVGFVTEGTVVIEQEGKRAVSAKAGESFLLAAGLTHRSTNPSARHARMFVTVFVERGGPMSVAAPAPGLPSDPRPTRK
jgi:hypothetical protein